ncbi:hypothetical protein [Polaromonas sp. CG9_12]|nr:hypothetical protein [Polaromonas sp. CG9_12]
MQCFTSTAAPTQSVFQQPASLTLGDTMALHQFLHSLIAHADAVRQQ